MYQYKAHVVRVLDGDTVEVRIDLGYDIHITKKIRIIAESHPYFDTPETWRPKTESEREHGKLATERALELLDDKDVILDSVKEGKYRYVAKIKLENNVDYADTMINEGFQKKDSYID